MQASDQLRPVWTRLVGAQTDDHSLQQTLWEEITVQYSGPKRHYHNLDHILYMANLARDCHALLTDPDTLLFSIFYHDVVYDAARKDNEAKSAETARVRLKRLGYPEARIQACTHQIMATKDHADAQDQDTCFLLDMDLAILGDSPEAYAAYTRKIRAEYSMFPDALYKPGRKNVLKHFLAMQHIFKTEHFRTAREPRARENLQAELDALRA